MPHTYSLENVPSHVAAGEAHYRQLLAAAAEARRFAPADSRQPTPARRASAALRRATRNVLMQLGLWLHDVTLPERTDADPSAAAAND